MAYPHEGKVYSYVTDEVLQGLTQIYRVTTKGLPYVYAAFYVKHTQQRKDIKTYFVCLYTYP